MPVDAATMIKTMSWILKGMPLELDVRNRPFTVGPCLSDASRQKCGTAEKVGYSCYGCISARFPINKGLFRQVENSDKEKPFDRTSKHTYMNYGRQTPRNGAQRCA